MPEDIIAYVCSDLSAHAPQAEAGLRDQACDRILGRYIQQEDLDRMRDDPDDLLACLQECITLAIIILQAAERFIHRTQ